MSHIFAIQPGLSPANAHIHKSNKKTSEWFNKVLRLLAFRCMR